MRIAVKVVLMMVLAAAGGGCQDYASLHEAGVVSEDGEPTGGDEWVDPGDGDPGWGDCCGPDDGDPYNPQDGDGPVDGGGDAPVDGGDEVTDGGDGPEDGGDGPGDGGDGSSPDCPQIGGPVWIAIDCGGEWVEQGEVIQTGCAFQLQSEPYTCDGSIAPDGRISLDCADLGTDCAGIAHLSGMPFGLTCEPNCSAGVFPMQGECFEQGMCPMVTVRCIAWAGGPDGLRMVTDCMEVNGPGPVADNTGQRCSRYSDCYSMWCLEAGFCAGLCMPGGLECPLVQLDRPCADDADCHGQAVCDGGYCSVPSTCQTRVVPMGPGPDGEEVFDWINLCLPEQRPCQRDGDCPDSAVCRLRPDLLGFEGFVQRCGPPGPGTGDLNVPCADCRTNVCVTDGDPGVCSRLCVTDADCQSPWVDGVCQDAQVWLLPGWAIPVRACVVP